MFDEYDVKRICRKYPLSPGDLRSIEEKQGSQCAGCGNSDKLFVDHDHSSGFVRGLLCRKCNFILGMCRDNPATLRNLEAYLSSAIAVREKILDGLSKILVLLSEDAEKQDALAKEALF